MKYLKRYESVLDKNTKIDIIKSVIDEKINDDGIYYFDNLKFQSIYNIKYDFDYISKDETRDIDFVDDKYIYRIIGKMFKNSYYKQRLDDSLGDDEVNNIYNYLKEHHPELDYLFNASDMGLL